jgi:hypothetical protein
VLLLAKAGRSSYGATSQNETEPRKQRSQDLLCFGVSHDTGGPMNVFTEETEISSRSSVPVWNGAATIEDVMEDLRGIGEPLECTGEPLE